VIALLPRAVIVGALRKVADALGALGGALVALRLSADPAA
jgi:hypothetical protein